MKIVKVQRRVFDTVIGIPAEMKEIHEGIEYMTCTVDEMGIHYMPIETSKGAKGHRNE